MTAQTDRQAALRAALEETLRTTPSTGNTHKPGEEKWDHHPAPGEQGHRYTYTCALCRNDLDALVPALIAAVERVMQPELDRLADYENRLTWETNCGEHARLLDSCYAEAMRAEKAEAERDKAQAALERVRAECDAIQREVYGQHDEDDDGMREAVRRIRAAARTEVRR